VLDDGYDVQRTLDNTRMLLNQHHALALFGYAGTGNIARLLSDKVLAEAGVALVGPYTGGEPLRTPYNPNIFHVRAGYADEAAVMVKMLTSTGIKQIAVMYQDDAFGKAGLQGVVDAMKPLGLAPIVTASYPKNTEDVAAAVATIGAQKPQAVILISVSKSSAAFLTQYRTISKSALIFNLSVVNPVTIARSIGDVDTRGFSITQVVPDANSHALAVAREYRTLLARYGKGAEPSATSFEEFLGAKTLVAGVRRAKVLDRAGVVAGLESLVKYDLGGYSVNFGPGNRRGSNYVDIVSVRKDGKMLR
jgi:ABC-type branched-subunit amino acid transport system substrate-binding protein